MIYTLRPYQREAVDSAINHIKKSLESQILVLPTAAGKSLVCSEIAKQFHYLSGKNVLCLAPSALLVKQNYEKYRSYDLPASIFCASLGVKSVRNNVVFASPLSVNNSLERFKDFGLVICDEAHLITKSVKSIIKHLREQNGNLRICGMTATPYSTRNGWIFEAHYQKKFMDDAINPFFKLCTFEVTAKYLLDNGFITKPVIGHTNLRYETEKLVLDKKGQYTPESIHETFEGKGRLTSEIIKDIVETTSHYFGGVLIFCATIQHCHEALESLPKDISAMVTGNISNRKKIENDFKNGKIKYLCNVATQTTGADYPETFCCALLRKTESPILITQIIGRSLRLHDKKPFALILDYAENIDFHFSDGDVFNPNIRAKVKNDLEKIPATCPECGHENQFAERPNDAGYGINHNGLFVWPDTGDIVLSVEGKPFPAHFGRRCTGLVGRTQRCDYYWSYKVCDSPCCSFMNDVASRFCGFCRFELCDPNEKLRLEQQEQKKQIAETPRTEPILNIGIEDNFKGDKRIKIVVIKTIFNKQIRLFLRVSKEEERNQYRYYRDNKTILEDKNVTFFRPVDGKFYKLIKIE